jgi:hypothetical protein
MKTPTAEKLKQVIFWIVTNVLSVFPNSIFQIWFWQQEIRAIILDFFKDLQKKLFIL